MSLVYCLVSVPDHTTIDLATKIFIIPRIVFDEEKQLITFARVDRCYWPFFCISNLWAIDFTLILSSIPLEFFDAGARDKGRICSCNHIVEFITTSSTLFDSINPTIVSCTVACIVLITDWVWVFYLLAVNLAGCTIPTHMFVANADIIVSTFSDSEWYARTVKLAQILVSFLFKFEIVSWIANTCLRVIWDTTWNGFINQRTVGNTHVILGKIVESTGTCNTIVGIRNRLLILFASTLWFFIYPNECFLALAWTIWRSKPIWIGDMLAIKLAFLWGRIPSPAVFAIACYNI